MKTLSIRHTFFFKLDGFSFKCKCVRSIDVLSLVSQSQQQYKTIGPSRFIFQEILKYLSSQTLTMKIKVPDDVDTFSEEALSDTQTTDDTSTSKTFPDEIKEILKLTKTPSKFVVDGADGDDSKLMLQVLTNFTQFCREEIFTRHVKVIGKIKNKKDEMQCQLICQQKQLEDLEKNRHQLQETMERLKAVRLRTQAKHVDLSIRLKESLQKLQDCCKNKTLAERKMARDLVDYKEQAKDLKVRLTDTSAKMNYYTSQVKNQTGVAETHTKPLYLDKNKSALIKTNLNTMRENIEDLVHRVKQLQMQAPELSENEYSTTN